VDTCHGFWTLHADFWNTWDHSALTTLVTDCLNGGNTLCLQGNNPEADIPNNDRVDWIAGITASC